MKNCCLFRDTLLVELTNELWAIIPASTLQPASISIGDLHQLLLAKGVVEREFPTRR
jgi:hypothetical protein